MSQGMKEARVPSKAGGRLVAALSVSAAMTPGEKMWIKPRTPKEAAKFSREKNAAEMSAVNV